MIESKLLKYLNEKLSVKAYMSEKEDDSFILIELNDLERENFITTATFNIYSYATSQLKASQLNQEVINVVDNFINDDNIVSCYLASARQSNDSTIKKYRYQCIYEITYY